MELQDMHFLQDDPSFPVSLNDSEIAAVRIFKKHWKSSAKLLPRGLTAGEKEM